MSDVKHTLSVAGAPATCYRITASGKAVAAWEHCDARTRHIVDLLELLQSSGHGVAETQLRQFMPPVPLNRAIASLLALGLIEPQPGSLGPARSTAQR
jgi:hypothetical protein